MIDFCLMDYKKIYLKFSSLIFFSPLRVGNVRVVIEKDSTAYLLVLVPQEIKIEYFIGN